MLILFWLTPLPHPALPQFWQQGDPNTTPGTLCTLLPGTASSRRGMLWLQLAFRLPQGPTELPPHGLLDRSLMTVECTVPMVQRCVCIGCFAWATEFRNAERREARSLHSGYGDLWSRGTDGGALLVWCPAPPPSKPNDPRS